jgi:Na+/H+ antiporter NhaD/arsenite permease-like protein
VAATVVVLATGLVGRHTLVQSGRTVSSTAFHRVSLAITPVSLFVGVGTLAVLGR